MLCLQAIKHCLSSGALLKAFGRLKGGLQSFYFSSSNHDELSMCFSPHNRLGTIQFRLLIAMYFHPWMVKCVTRELQSRRHKFPRRHSKIHGHSLLSLFTLTMGELCSCYSPQDSKENCFLPSWPTLHGHERNTGKSFKTGGWAGLLVLLKGKAATAKCLLGELAKVYPKSSHKDLQ